MFMGASTKQGYDIAHKSREIVRSLIGDKIDHLTSDEKAIVERIVHSTADPEYAELTIMSEDFVSKSIKSLKKGEDILTDINMVRAGINNYSGEVNCFISHPDVIKNSKDKQITRAAAAMQYAAENEFQGIVVIGNAPTALYEVIDLFNKDLMNIKSVIGVPVGFVGAADSKEDLNNSEIPHLITKGPKGGTPVAVATINALINFINKKSNKYV
ncbi:cobalt-precorrin-8 methylmutase [Methanobacterium alcaliphilum]|uniref:cobalt-precorrin-8 methylmutase n=1 Tax=Methanobacterium alcaliphilum TaxID=392018 RepID=UPI00200A4F09|nr:cobalt-precorrin-8 methylmutase [Methanobacterium alcaliphilum]MCK9152385.1 cobalt-precorrin-8 methylmutase [Methanobacterium alcaliphilum]